MSDSKGSFAIFRHNFDIISILKEFHSIGRFVVACLSRYKRTMYREVFLRSFVASSFEIHNELRRQIDKRNKYPCAWPWSWLEMIEYRELEAFGWLQRDPDDWLFSLRRTWYECGVIRYDCDNEEFGFKTSRDTMQLTKVVKRMIPEYKKHIVQS